MEVAEGEQPCHPAQFLSQAALAQASGSFVAARRGQTLGMYGTHAGLTYGGLALATALVIALFFAASPLFAVVIAVIAIAGLVVVKMLRRRSGEVEEPEQAPLTSAGRAKSPTGSRSGGAPVSGEG
jgi:predicted lipid-binding transport protein (Tim44 family)